MSGNKLLGLDYSYILILAAYHGFVIDLIERLLREIVESIFSLQWVY